jgi:hypothetical protein
MAGSAAACLWSQQQQTHRQQLAQENQQQVQNPQPDEGY